MPSTLVEVLERQGFPKKNRRNFKKYPQKKVDRIFGIWYYTIQTVYFN